MEVVFGGVSRQKPNITKNTSVGAPIDWEKCLGVLGFKRFNGLGIKGKGKRVRV